ncbi:Hypothetical protein HEAR2333 [Herminiimonas arsenicoxydans]|uniref:Uncharacterized protein n=1 Tax=Herminiimonas arsenicoxydans TaxID=204773 RepID=A4G7H7_HERAR|nr:Hypothetical protein HEAR2333 [Herminiimonas arsenicoxydans]
MMFKRFGIAYPPAQFMTAAESLRLVEKAGTNVIYIKCDDVPVEN